MDLQSWGFGAERVRGKRRTRERRWMVLGFSQEKKNNNLRGPECFVVLI